MCGLSLYLHIHLNQHWTVRGHGKKESVAIPNSGVFQLLQSDKLLHIQKANTERLSMSFSPQAIRIIYVEAARGQGNDLC